MYNLAGCRPELPVLGKGGTWHRSRWAVGPTLLRTWAN